MAALARESCPGCYTWTFPGCPLQIRVRLEVVTALQRLTEGPHDTDALPPFSGGLLLGDTASPGVTEVAGIEPLAALDALTVEAAIGRAAGQVVGFFRTTPPGSFPLGANLRMTDDDVALANVLFHQPSSVVLLIEILEPGSAKAAFFFWDGGNMLGDFSLMDFPLDSRQLAALESQRKVQSPLDDAATAPPAISQIEPETNLIPVVSGEGEGSDEAPAVRTGPSWRRRAACAASVLAIMGIPAYFYSKRFSYHVATPARQLAPALAPAPTLGFTVDRRGTDLLLSWDRHSPAVSSATFGVVLIRENERTTNVALTPEQLRFGSVQFKPTSDQVDIELNVATGDRLTRELVIAVLPGWSEAAGARP